MQNSGDQSNSTTTGVLSTDLTLTLTPGLYSLSVCLLMTGSSAGGARVWLTINSGTIGAGGWQATNSLAQSAYTSGSVATSGQTAYRFLGQGIIEVLTTVSITVRFAQNTADATATVLKTKSFFMSEKVA